VNDVESIKKAAEDGDAKAQFSLGFMYVEGRGVPKDVVHAHAWLSLAAWNGHDAARDLLESLAKDMTADQIRESKKLAWEWAMKFKSPSDQE
jgi:TPR repeat protein